MRIHREGIEILILSFFILVATIVLLFFFSKYLLINIILSLAIVILFGFEVWFFRNPIRNTFSKPLDIVAPVDGKVVEIKKVYEGEYLKEEVWQVSIFMSPLNVHVCRYPVSGEVVYTKYHPGKYLVAFHPKSSELNERTTVVVEAENQNKVLFRQIAGAVARRIVLYSKDGDNAKAGDEYGFIKFGSRLDIFLPLDATITAKIGDKTKGGEEIIGTLRPY